jgi:DNA-binding winged helix-turn-helix (wHTH) protein/Tfp pilus assembly protein PilF
MARYVAREYRFGPFTLEPASGTLRKNGERVSADLRLIRFITALVKKQGRTVSRATLEKELWPEHQAVRSGNLDVLACQARKLLEDNPRDPRFVRTDRARGYRFICSVIAMPLLAGDSAIHSTVAAICEKARHRWVLRTSSSIQESIWLYGEAIKEDPTYALAWSGRADAWIMAGIHCLMPPSDAFRRARSDAADALRFAPQAPEGLVSEAWVKLCLDRDLLAAKRDFERALTLNPKYPFAHNGMALFHLACGRPRLAVKALERACSLRAASPFLNALWANALYQARDYEKARRRGILAVEADPDFAVGHTCLGLIHMQSRDFGRGVEHLERACQLSDGGAVMLGFLANAYGVVGKRDRAAAILNRLTARRTDNKYVPAYFLALAELGLERHGRALNELNRAFQERSHWVLFLRTEPLLDSLRSDYRFGKLLNAL